MEIETLLIGRPDVVEAAGIGVPDDRWTERPLACVVLRDGATGDPAALREFLTGKVAKWWLPERWSFVEAIPRTSVGKFDKKASGPAPPKASSRSNASTEPEYPSARAALG